jgi:two-component system sensor histidine kinase PilS (NtrC family)
VLSNKGVITAVKNIDDSTVPGSAEQRPGNFATAGFADSYWRSLQYFSVYRLVVSAVFLIAVFVTQGGTRLAFENPALFLWADTAYLVAACAFLVVVYRSRRHFNLQLSLQIVCDVFFLTILMHVSGGPESGIVFMLWVVVAGAALVGEGQLTLFFAALATLAVLSEQSVRSLRSSASFDDFFRTGLSCIGFFVTAVIVRMLARRVVRHEELARRRGIDLADHSRINRQVIQNMDDGVLVVNAAGIVHLLNPQAETLLGADRQAGIPLTEYWPDLARLHAPRLADEVTDVLKAPSVKLLLCRRQPSEGGRNTLIFLQDLDRIQAQTRQIKLAALGRLTANIAHEIRNPLASITSAGELLVDEEQAETRGRLLRIIGDNANRLNRLVGEVLDLGRRDLVQPELINLAAFLAKFVEDHSVQDAETQRRIRVEAKSGDVLCFDRAHLYRILENLVINALRYASHAPGAVTIGVMAAAEQVEVHVIDDGPGIPAADRNKIFEPFFTTSNSGTGLGLYIARELSEANGARLDLLESPVGTHFRLLAKGGPCPPSLIATAETT